MSKKIPIINFSKINSLEKANADIEALSKMIQQEFLPFAKLLGSAPEIESIGRNFFVIRIVTVFESFLKNKVIEIVDNNEMDISSLFSTGEIKIPLSRFEDIRQKDFTKGRIVASNFNFQDLNDVNFVFSNLLQLNFFDTIRGLKDLSGPKQDMIKEFTQEINLNWNELCEFFVIRHKVVHTLTSMNTLKPDVKYDKMIFSTVFHFLMLGILVIEWAVHIKKGGGVSPSPSLFHAIKQSMKKYQDRDKKTSKS